MTTREELEALPTKELYDRTIGTAKRRLDVGFFWDLLKALPVAEEVIGDDQRSKTDIHRPLALLNDLLYDADSGRSARRCVRCTSTTCSSTSARTARTPTTPERDLASYRDEFAVARPQGLPDQRVARAGLAPIARAARRLPRRLGRRRARPTTCGSRTSSRRWPG